jgi:hypothetical protein
MLRATGATYDKADEARISVRGTRTCDGLGQWHTNQTDGTWASLRDLRHRTVNRPACPSTAMTARNEPRQQPHSAACAWGLPCASLAHRLQADGGVSRSASSALSAASADVLSGRDGSGCTTIGVGNRSHWSVYDVPGRERRRLHHPVPPSYVGDDHLVGGNGFAS